MPSLESVEIENDESERESDNEITESTTSDEADRESLSGKLIWAFHYVRHKSFLSVRAWAEVVEAHPRQAVKTILVLLFLLISIVLGVDQQQKGGFPPVHEVIDLQQLGEELRLRVTEAYTTLTQSMPKTEQYYLLGKLAAGKGVVNASHPEFNEHLAGFFQENAELKPMHPVVMIPGIISTGLEVWEADKSCWGGFLASEVGGFRERLWGTTDMIKKIVSAPLCWWRHMSLDPETGLDPPGIRLRAASGLEGNDYFMGGYWVWGPIIEALGGMGYDASNMAMMGYDWRLSLENLEKRDKYFTRLAATVEMLRRSSDHQHKVVMLAHSLGATNIGFFLQWVTRKHGPNWVEDNISHIVGIGGAFLGAPSAYTALRSGEYKDTAALGSTLNSMLEALLNRDTRKELMATWGSVVSLLPKGGMEVWGDLLVKNEEHAHSIATLFDMHHMRQHKHKQHGVLASKIQSAAADSSLWGNPLTVPLPKAPDMSILCLYGVDINATEIGYAYDGDSLDLSSESGGVVTGNGDGTVPLRSLGYMCERGWKKAARNPSKVPTVNREYIDNPHGFRGSGASGNHVNIMGNLEMIADILRVVGGAVPPSEVQNMRRVHTQLEADCDEIDARMTKHH